MKIELKHLNKENIGVCTKMRVSAEQAEFICSNEKSLKEAEENPDVARTFLIYADGIAVGFTMFAFDAEYPDENDRFWLWKLMIDEKFQGRGHGKRALTLIIDYFRSNGANNVRLSTKENNLKAIALYESFGFKKTDQMNGEERVFELVF